MVCTVGAKWAKNEAQYEELRRLAADGMTAPQLAAHFGIHVEAIRKRAIRLGLTIVPSPVRKMETHPSWRGGKIVDRHGYILTRVDAAGEFGYLIRGGRPRRRSDGTLDDHGYAAEHRIVMHKRLGRRLRRGEVVHHIDDDVQNNDPANLELFVSNAEHLRATITGQVPAWTPEGRARMTGRPPKSRWKASQP